MSYMTIPVPSPLFIGSEDSLLAGVSTQILTINIVFVFAFEIPNPITLSSYHWATGATATGHTNMAIYTIAGAIIAGTDTGSISNTASTTFSQANTTQLQPGQYLLAIASDNGTDTYNGQNLATSGKSLLTRFAQAANALAAGAMPLTLGALSNTVKCPAIGVSFSGSLH